MLSAMTTVLHSPRWSDKNFSKEPSRIGRILGVSFNLFIASVPISRSECDSCEILAAYLHAECTFLLTNS